MKKIYGIEKGRIGIFPYSEIYESACEEGDMEAFIREDKIRSEKCKDKYFKSCVEKAAKMILAENTECKEKTEVEHEIPQE